MAVEGIERNEFVSVKVRITGLLYRAAGDDEITKGR